MFERFTHNTRRVVTLALDEVATLKHAELGTSHLLLGLIDEGDGTAAQVLRELGVTHDRVRAQLTEGGVARTGHIPFTRAARSALQGSDRVRAGLAHGSIGTEHLLLALTHAVDLDWVALGTDANAVRVATVQRFNAAE